MAQNPGFTVWLTGMLGAGKSTMANYIAARLRQVGRNVEVLDEDDIAEVFWGDIEGATKEEWDIISKRMAGVAELLTRNGTCVMVALTSPYKTQRDEARRQIQRFVEVYVDCPTDDLIKRDSTGKYKKALAGEIPHFIGITKPYEPPSMAEVTIETNVEEIEAGGLRVFQSLLDFAFMSPEELKIITGTKMKANPKARRPAKNAKAARARPVSRPASKAKAAKRKR